MVVLAKKVASMIAADYVANKNAPTAWAGNGHVTGIMQKMERMEFPVADSQAAGASLICPYRHTT